MKPAIYSNRRPNGLAIDPIKTHLRTEFTEARCKQKPGMMQPLRLTNELAKVTCGRCHNLLAQEQARISKLLVSEESGR